MKVWWCETHNTVDFDVCLHGGEPPCRMVEMRLVSVDALVVEKVGGEWPEWAVETCEQIIASASAQLPKDPWDYDP